MNIYEQGADLDHEYDYYYHYNNMQQISYHDTLM